MAVFLVRHFYMGSKNGGQKVRHIKMMEKWEKKGFFELGIGIVLGIFVCEVEGGRPWERGGGRTRRRRSVHGGADGGGRSGTLAGGSVHEGLRRDDLHGQKKRKDGGGREEGACGRGKTRMGRLQGVGRKAWRISVVERYENFLYFFVRGFFCLGMGISPNSGFWRFLG
jgi:hypothetical protein